MPNPSFAFVDYSYRTGEHWRRWRRCPISGLGQVRFIADNRDVYCTIQQFANSREVPGEPCIMPFCVDLDDSKNLDHAIDDGRRLVGHLVSAYGLPEAAVRVWFSGNRGLHVIMELGACGIEPSPDLHLIVKLWVLHMADQLGLKSCDRTIYSTRRMWRLADSIHSKTNLYKVELSHAELMSLDGDAIRTLAAKARGTLWLAEDLAFQASPAARADFEQWRDAVRSVQPDRALTTAELAQLAGDNDPACIRVLLTEFPFQPGSANSALLQFACYLKGRGVSQGDAEDRVIAYAITIPASKLSKHSSERERATSARSVVRSVYATRGKDYRFSPLALQGLVGGCPEPACKLCAIARPRKNKVGVVPADKVQSPGAIECSTLDAAREAIRDEMLGIMREAKPGAHVFVATSGAGKSMGALLALEELAKSGTWPMNRKGHPLRVAFLTDTLEQVEEIMFGKMSAEDMPHVLRMSRQLRGRMPQPNVVDSFGGDDKWLCKQFDKVQALARMRHAPLRDACLACPDAAECESYHYLASVQDAMKAQIVLACKAGMLSDYTSRLKEFGVVIVDEALLPWLLTKVENIRDQAIARWQENIQAIDDVLPAYGSGHPLVRLFGLLRATFASTPAANGATSPLMPHLRRVADEKGFDLVALLEEAATCKPSDQRGQRFDFEAPGKCFEPNWPEPPLRATADLIRAIHAERNRPDEADTRLWLRRIPGGATAIEMYLRNDGLLEVLRGRTVINLDGTPSPLLSEAITGLTIHRHEYTVSQALQVHQFTDGRFTQSSLLGRQGAVLKRVSKAVDVALKAVGSIRPAVLTFKACRPDLPGNAGKPTLDLEHPAALWGHYGSDERGLDAFMGCDCLVLVGTYCQNIGEIERQVQALRFSEQPPRGTATESRQAYEFVATDGTGRDYPIKIHSDRDVQAAIEHSMSSTVIQGAGRLRAACRAREDGRPFPVIVFAAQPIAGLRVATLETMHSLLEQYTNPANAARWLAAQKKIDAAVAAGVTGTRALARATGLNVRRIVKHQQRSGGEECKAFPPSVTIYSRQQGETPSTATESVKAFYTGVTNTDRQQPATPGTDWPSLLAGWHCRQNGAAEIDWFNLVVLWEQSGRPAMEIQPGDKVIVLDKGGGMVEPEPLEVMMVFGDMVGFGVGKSGWEAARCIVAELAIEEVSL